MSRRNSVTTGVPLRLAVGTTMTILTGTIVSAGNNATRRVRRLAVKMFAQTLTGSTIWTMTYHSDPNLSCPTPTRKSGVSRITNAASVGVNARRKDI